MWIDQFCTKAILDLIYLKNIDKNNKNGITLIQLQKLNLGEFLSQLELEDIKEIFSKIPNEYPIFINILTTLLDHYKKYNLENNSQIKK